MAVRKEAADILLRVSCRTVVHAPRRFYFLLACRPDAMSRRLFSCYRHYSGKSISGGHSQKYIKSIIYRKANESGVMVPWLTWQ